MKDNNDDEEELKFDSKTESISQRKEPKNLFEIKKKKIKKKQ